ncbi:MAG: DNA cytosine methyltransferase [Sedimentisphaerales bacterium]
MQRIAKGLRKFVIEAKEPFVIGVGGPEGQRKNFSTRQPLNTITLENNKALIVPYLSKYHKQKAGESRCETPVKPIATVDTSNRFALVEPYLLAIDHKKGNASYVYPPEQPLRTITTENRFALITAFLSKYYKCSNPCAAMNRPLPTITSIDHNAIVTSHLTKFYGTNIGSDMRSPVPTVTATGTHIGEVRAFLIKYYGTNIGQTLKKPMHTITTKDRLGLVTIQGQEYQIADIGLRMLTPRELALAQGFPANYILTGKSKSSQVAKIGNSVCPPIAEAIVRVNVKLQEIEAKATA